METIIQPIDRNLLIRELTQARFVKRTNNGNNEIYIVDYHNSPNLLQEIGRLREITFRDAGGGTGKAVDIDEFDTIKEPFQQLLVWNPRDMEIIGGYRFIHGKNISFHKDGTPQTPTAELFKFSQKFIVEYLPKTIELGRSFVQPAYQPTVNLRKGMFALDNIWDGLGAIIKQNPDVEYFFGKITMYPDYNKYARDLVLYFMKTFFPDHDDLVKPIADLELAHPKAMLARHFTGETYDENYKILLQQIRLNHENIPPLVNAYMSLSSTMRTFGTTLNPGFGDVEETGIIVTIKDIYDFKKVRHLGH